MPVRLELFLQFPVSNMVFMFLTYYACSVLRSINSRKTFKVLVKTSGFAIVWKSISSFMFCTQNNVFVVDEESRGWEIVSFCVPGGGE